jgi:SAM-dependent methyltransferase
MAGRPVEVSEPAEITARAVGWLRRQHAARPAAVEEAHWAYAIGYASDRYQVGLEHYRRLFDALGWSGKRRGLDIGSGAGHWALAFALDNCSADGIDPAAEFVELANSAAAAAGLAERVRHRVGRAEALDFPDGHFDAVWSSELMYGVDIEDAIAEVARILEPGGQFYCGYSASAFVLPASTTACWAGG